MNYVTYPVNTAKYLYITSTNIDVESEQAIIVEDGEELLTLTTVQDTAKVVAKALDYEGKWPEIGGIVGSRIKSKDLIALVEKVKG